MVDDAGAPGFPPTQVGAPATGPLIKRHAPRMLVALPARRSGHPDFVAQHEAPPPGAAREAFFADGGNPDRPQ